MIGRQTWCVTQADHAALHAVETSRSSSRPVSGQLSGAPSARIGAVKLRLGITLWILSWIPYGLILGLSGASLTIAWTVEIVLGITGIAIAGTEFGQAVKDEGWKGAPLVAWRSLLHGQGIQASE